MNALTRRNPGKEMDDLQDRWAKFFGLVPVRVTSGGKEAMTVAEWAPLGDISEDDRERLLKAGLLRR
jgi:HSP20 family protein